MNIEKNGPLKLQFRFPLNRRFGLPEWEEFTVFDIFFPIVVAIVFVSIA